MHYIFAGRKVGTAAIAGLVMSLITRDSISTQRTILTCRSGRFPQFQLLNLKAHFFYLVLMNYRKNERPKTRL
jgi:hypothetical protein